MSIELRCFTKFKTAASFLVVGGASGEVGVEKEEERERFV